MPQQHALGAAQQGASLVAVHVAEYQMITTRNTYWLTLMYALWPILFLAWGLLAQVQKDFGLHPSVWMAALVSHVIILTFLMISIEGYRNVLYIEKKLRPTLASLVGTKMDAILGYEDFLIGDRKKGYAWWEGTYWSLLLPMVATALALIWIGPSWVRMDALWLGANVVGLSAVVGFARRTSQLRHELAEERRRVDVLAE